MRLGGRSPLDALRPGLAMFATAAPTYGRDQRSRRESAVKDAA
jgi:hypothetical protein